MAYEMAVIASTLGPALIATMLAHVFPETQGVFKFFFSWIALLFCTATTYLGYAIAESGGYTAISILLLPLTVCLMIISVVWIIIFVIGLISNYLDTTNKQATKGKTGDYERSY